MPKKVTVTQNEIKQHEVVSFETKQDGPDLQDRKIYYTEFCERWALAELGYAAPEARMELRQEFWDRKWCQYDEFELFAKDNRLWIPSMESLA